jgi:hypothetical protein
VQKNGIWIIRMPFAFFINMNITKIWPVLLVFTACATAPTPSLVSFFVETGVIQYFLSPTDWMVQDSGTKAPKAKARLDITYRTGADSPATVNISFFGEKSIPRKITSIALNGNGIVYPLENIVVLYPEPEKRELRITTEGNRDTLMSVLEADIITLTAEIDGVLYTYTPDKNFITLKNDFLTATSYF